jgi:hypothetical protein
MILVVHTEYRVDIRPRRPVDLLSPKQLDQGIADTRSNNKARSRSHHPLPKARKRWKHQETDRYPPRQANNRTARYVKHRRPMMNHNYLKICSAPPAPAPSIIVIKGGKAGCTKLSLPRRMPPRAVGEKYNRHPHRLHRHNHHHHQ